MFLIVIGRVGCLTISEARRPTRVADKGLIPCVANELGVRHRQRVVEVRQGVALAPSKIGRDLGLQDVA